MQQSVVKLSDGHLQPIAKFSDGNQNPWLNLATDCKFPSLSLARSVLPTEFFSVANSSLKDLKTDLFDLATEKSIAKSPESCSVILRSAPKQSKVGNWERCLVLIGIHKKLELIKSNKIPALPRLPVVEAVALSASPINDSIEERVWSDIFVIGGQSVASTVVSPVEEKVSALLSQGAIHPITKKAAMRVLDKLRSLNPFLKGLESVELDDSGMVWTEELSHVCLSAVTAINHFINKTEQLKRRSWMGNSRRFLSAFGKVKSRDKLAVEMDKIYAKIKNLSIHRPTAAVNRPAQSTTPKSIPPQPTTQQLDLASFGDDVQAMISRLLTEDQSFRVIAIMGMEGIGKTTLAELIFNHKAVIDHFPLGVWTLDGHRLLLRDKDNIVESDLSLLRGPWCLKEEMQQPKAFFINNRSLIVLDGSHFLYKQMLEVLQDTLNGNRMILTNFKTWLPPNLNRKNDPHPLRLRTDEESWALFTHALKLNIPQNCYS